jgi:hypothetical protein
MSDNMRWRYGETNPVMAAVDSATVIEIGDLIWLDTDDAKNAEDVSWTSDLPTTQKLLANAFLGVAMQRSKSGETTPIRVATSGVFEFTCASAVHELGDFFAAAKQSGNYLESQKVVKLETFVNSNLSSVWAIGSCARRDSVAATTVLIDIKSRVMHGGIVGGSYSL